MSSVDEHIRSTDEVITQNISNLADSRGLLSQNILSQLRNLVEAVASRIMSQNGDIEYEYSIVQEGLEYIRTRGQYSFLSKFHRLLQVSASHYTFKGDGSERLMLKYYEYLLRLRSVVENELDIKILQNIELFPIDLDPSIHEYHEKIAEVIESTQTSTSISLQKTGRYYIHSIKPFFANYKIYYEVTFYKAIDRIDKFNRNIAFTSIDIIDKYAANLTLIPASINVLENEMDIFIISDWQVSIRPCEFNNFAKIFGQNRRINTKSLEYRNLMGYLTRKSWNLLDIIDMNDYLYNEIKKDIIQESRRYQIFHILDEARKIIEQNSPGRNIIRYLLLRMNNRVIKKQWNNRGVCSRLSNLNLKYGCIPFEDMPYCSSPIGHIPHFWDLIESINPAGRKHEFIARKVKGNTEYHGVIYTPISELTDEPENLSSLKSSIDLYNKKLYSKHAENRQMIIKNDHVFIKEYENNIAYIIENIQGYVSEGLEGYSDIVNKWLNENSNRIDDPLKNKIIENIFKESKIAVIYGAAGTGKSTMINYVSEVFEEKTKLFLANTHAAVDNLKHRVSNKNSKFQTIASFLQNNNLEYELLVIDECSMVNNENMVEILKNSQLKSSFKNLLLVGDTYQIESIKFGNWFDIIRSFIPESSVYELSTPYRTQSKSLIDFWTSVRESKDDVTEKIVRHGYSAPLSSSLFNISNNDEVILCLNYDGLYGINNINRFLQTANKNKFCDIGVERYKVGDPILFNETQRFGQEIHNNVKGKIINFEWIDGGIQFDIQIDKNNISTRDGSSDHKWINESTVRFEVYDLGSTDEDDDSDNTTVPFQVAYATSIHKAQGLEYDSVKIVITDANEDDITHNIFYTAITRARKNLMIFWTPETEQAIISRLEHRTNTKDIALLKAWRGLKPLK